MWQIFWHSVWHIFWHSIWSLLFGSGGPLRSRPFCSGPVGTTLIWRLLFGSGRDQSDAGFAVRDRRQCDPGLLLGYGTDHCDLELAFAVPGDHCDLACSSEERRTKEGIELTQNLTTLTWQMGENNNLGIHWHLFPNLWPNIKIWKYSSPRSTQGPSNDHPGYHVGCLGKAHGVPDAVRKVFHVLRVVSQTVSLPFCVGTLSLPWQWQVLTRFYSKQMGRGGSSPVVK